MQRVQLRFGPVQVRALAEERAGGEPGEEHDGRGHDGPHEGQAGPPGRPLTRRPGRRLAAAGPALRSRLRLPRAMPIPPCRTALPVPGKLADSPRSSSMRSSWLYLATRSERAGAPVLICPALTATARSAIVVSSVSPERCEITVPYDGPVGQRHRVERLGQRADLVELDQDRHWPRPHGCPAPGSRRWSRRCHRPPVGPGSPSALVQAAQPSQSSSAMPSSMETIG